MVDNETFYFNLLNDYLLAQDLNENPVLDADNALEILRNCSANDIDSLLDRFGDHNESKRLRVKSLLTYVSDRLPFKIRFNDSEELLDCSISQFALPIVLQSNTGDGVDFNPTVPGILIERISQLIAKMIGLRKCDTLIINEALLTKKDLSMSIKNKYMLPERFLSEGFIHRQSKTISLNHREDSSVVFLYCIAIRQNDFDFEGYSTDKLFMNTDSIVDLRNELTNNLTLWFSNKKINAEPYCGIPGTFPLCLDSSVSIQREIKFSSYFEKSPLAYYENIVAVINHNESEGLMIRLFQNNSCIMVFSYGQAIVYDRHGNYLDHHLMAARIRNQVTKRVIFSTESTNAYRIEDLVDQPLIQSR